MKKLLTVFILLLSITAIAETRTQQRLSSLEKRVKKIEKAISYRLDITGNVTDNITAENVTAELMELVKKQNGVTSFLKEDPIGLEIDDRVTVEQQKIYFKILNACFERAKINENGKKIENQAFQIDTVWLTNKTETDYSPLAFFNSDKWLGLRLNTHFNVDEEDIKDEDVEPYIDACVTKVTLRKRDIK